MRIGIAQINSTLGDFKSNAQKILEFSEKAKQHKCDLVIFPEASLFGYHPFDLLAHKHFVEEQMKAYQFITKKIPKDIGIVFGLFTKTNLNRGRPYYNSAVLIEKNKKPRFFHKELLPVGDIFDETRYVAAGNNEKNFFKYKGKNILLTICEDIWAWPQKNKSPHVHNPLIKHKSKKIDLVINLSASPYYTGKIKAREFMVRSTALFLKAPMVYVNMSGGQDELVYDGGSLVCDSRGKICSELVHFEEAFSYFDLEHIKKNRMPQLSEIERIRKALVVGIRDFCVKTGLQSVHLGLSGGIDSAVVAALAVDALGSHRVKCLALPTKFNSSLSLKYAKDLCKNLNIEFKEFSIEEIFSSTKQQIDQHFSIKEFSLVHENMQARIRSLILMAFSNHQNSLLLSTSNKSEYAVGYSTLYGDMCGGLAPIGDLTKKQVYELAQLYNKENEVIPSWIIERAPSAELRPNQKDQDSLPEYDLLDSAVQKLVNEEMKANAEVERWTQVRLYRTEFKRWQAPPIIKVSQRAFGKGRRWPIAFKF